ncbi:MAG: type II CRISPR-associated endonuclease Cas1 [Turicibacter sp.]|nr:type II CRISPR-associated endonuclease Cas1 [Turicibacter sp.]
MSWRTVLVEDGESLRLKLDSIVIEKQGRLFTIPLSDIGVIVVDGQGATISTRLLSSLGKNNIALINCDETHHPNGIFTAFNGHSRASKMIQKQITLDDATKGEIWRKLISYKIENQYKILKHFEKSQQSLEKLNKYYNQIEDYDRTNREGHAAKVYFNELFGKDFSRNNEEHIVNAGLNYGYSILRAHLARCVVAYGLSPMLGIFHRSEYNQFNLVDDLIEPFRPFVDCFVYQNLKEERYFRAEHRRELITLMNKRCRYKEGQYTLQSILEKFVIDFITVVETGEFDKIINPSLEYFEVLV